MPQIQIKSKRNPNDPAPALTARKKINIFIGSRIAAFRKIANMPQKTLAGLLNPPLTQQQFSKYEQGRDTIPAYLLFEIAQVFGVTVESFMPLDVNPVAESNLSASSLDKALKMALQTFKKHAGVTEKELAQLEKSLSILYKN